MKRSPIDHRSGDDNRRSYNLDYFFKGGEERRRLLERHILGERRRSWVQVNRWGSVYLGA